MNDFIFGLLCGFWLYMLIDIFLLNIIYLKNISLFEDICLTKKNRDRLRSYYETKKH